MLPRTSVAKDRPRICLIQPPKIAALGVGETTVPHTIREAGTTERDFFRETNASFNLAL